MYSGIPAVVLVMEKFLLWLTDAYIKNWRLGVVFSIWWCNVIQVLYSTLDFTTVTHHLSCWAKKWESFAANGISVNNNLSIVYK
jgi:hypothetical protein